MRNVCKIFSSRPTGLFCRRCWNDSACSLFSATTTQLFSRNLFSHTFCSCLQILSTTNNLCFFWHCKFQQITTHAFCFWDDVFTQEWNCGSPIKWCKCTGTAPTFSTNTFVEWNLYLSSSNHVATSFRLEMNVGSFSEHQKQDERY